MAGPSPASDGSKTLAELAAEHVREVSRRAEEDRAQAVSLQSAAAAEQERHDKELGVLQGQLREARGRGNELAAALKAATEEVGVLQREVGAARGEMGQLRGKLGDAREQLRAKRKEVDDEKGRAEGWERHACQLAQELQAEQGLREAAEEGAQVAKAARQAAEQERDEARMARDEEMREEAEVTREYALQEKREAEAALQEAVRRFEAEKNTWKGASQTATEALTAVQRCVAPQFSPMSRLRRGPTNPLSHPPHGPTGWGYPGGAPHASPAAGAGLNDCWGQSSPGSGADAGSGRGSSARFGEGRGHPFLPPGFNSPWRGQRVNPPAPSHHPRSQSPSDVYDLFGSPPSVAHARGCWSCGGAPAAGAAPGTGGQQAWPAAAGGAPEAVSGAVGGEGSEPTGGWPWPEGEDWPEPESAGGRAWAEAGAEHGSQAAPTCAAGAQGGSAEGAEELVEEVEGAGEERLQKEAPVVLDKAAAGASALRRSARKGTPRKVSVRGKEEEGVQEQRGAGGVPEVEGAPGGAGRGQKRGRVAGGNAPPVTPETGKRGRGKQTPLTGLQFLGAGA